jgi:hypothetical protein
MKPNLDCDEGSSREITRIIRLSAFSIIVMVAYCETLDGDKFKEL